MTKPKIIFEEGCFDSMEDITQDELNELIAHIEDMVESGEFFDNAVPVSELSDEEQAEIEHMLNKQKRTRQ